MSRFVRGNVLKQSPDNNENKQTRTKGSFAKLSERGENPRRLFYKNAKTAEVIFLSSS